MAVSGLSDDKLALNNAASFTANVAGYDGDPSTLRYRWVLSTARGELSDGTNPLTSPVVGGETVRAIGKTAGGERITVGVLTSTGTVLATASTDFTVVAPTDPGISRGCFDQPKIYFQQGSTYYAINYDGSGQKSLGISGGTNAAISPNGEWIAATDDSPAGWDMYIQRCDGSDRRKIEGGSSEDSIARFSPDSKTLYFMRPEPSTPIVPGKFRPSDIAAYDLATRQLRFVTKIGPSDEYVDHFTVSPVTGQIAFLRKNLDPENPSTRLSFVQPENGLIRDFTTLPGGFLSLDWSPDGKDIILSGQVGDVRGIYRINVTDGSQPLLLFPDPSPNSSPPRYPHYYAGGSRIVWAGQENGQNNINLWSIDANGNDMKQLTDLPGTEFMQGVLH